MSNTRKHILIKRTDPRHPANRSSIPDNSIGSVANLSPEFLALQERARVEKEMNAMWAQRARENEQFDSFIGSKVVRRD